MINPCRLGIGQVPVKFNICMMLFFVEKARGHYILWYCIAIQRAYHEHAVLLTKACHYCGFHYKQIFEASGYLKVEMLASME